MSELMLALGGYRFSMAEAAYQSLRRSDAWRWATQERIGREPALQFVGAGKAEVEIEGVIYPHHRGGLGQIDRMRAEAGKGVPLRLNDGYGHIWGRWVIERLEETQSKPLANGAPRKVEFRLSLGKYGDDA